MRITMRLPRSRTTQLHHQHLLRDRDFLRSRLDRKTPRRRRRRRRMAPRSRSLFSPSLVPALFLALFLFFSPRRGAAATPLGIARAIFLPSSATITLRHRQTYEAEMLARASTRGCSSRGSAIAASYSHKALSTYQLKGGEANSISRIIGIG